MSDLFLNILYDINNDVFEVDTNIKENKINDIVLDHLRNQMGKGADLNEANELEKYKIRIEVDLSFDIFKITDNCGNKGLRDGILLHFLRKYE